MRPYIEQGRFGEFVKEFISAERKRRLEQVEQESERMMWAAYIHSYSEKSYLDWKADVMKPASSSSTGKKDDDMTKADIDNLMKHLFKEETPGQNATT